MLSRPAGSRRCEGHSIPWGFSGGWSRVFPFEISCCKAGFCRVSGNSAERACLVAPNARLDRHKMIKSRVMGLSKAGSRWYIPLAPKGVRPGCLLRKPPDGIDRRLRALAKSVSVSVFCKGAQWFIAGWSSPVARQAHNLKVIASDPIPADLAIPLETPIIRRCLWKA